MARRMVRPLHRLTAYARLLPRQQLEEARETRSPIADLPARNRDEVGRLAEAFLMMEERLRDNVRQLMRETSARERIESELAIARELQLGLLPVIADEIGDEEPVEIHAVVRPAKEVGGDLFDVFRVRPRVLCLAVGDVSGKGVPGAFFMGVAKTLLRVAAEGAAEPGSVVARVNDALSRNNPNLMFVTLFVAFLDLDTGALTYVNAGHPPPLLLPAGEGGGRLLPGLSGPACGVMEGLPYRAFEASLATGDLLAIFTDGVTDAADAADQLFGDERTQATLQRLREASPRAVVEGLVAELDRFAEGTPQADDVTVLALRLRASEAPILTETAKEPATCAVPALS
jgi:phosphoserine phosphatase RsbU/P